jgi:hypothetical protein
MAVALPDMCVSLSETNGRTSAEKYKEWCRDNLGPEFSFLTPEDLYSIRCGVLHNGRFGDLKHNVARVIFALPNGAVVLQDNIINDAYIYSAVEFCRNLTRAVFEWCEAHQADAIVQANLPRLVQYRRGGLRPYILGVDLLG